MTLTVNLAKLLIKSNNNLNENIKLINENC